MDFLELFLTFLASFTSVFKSGEYSFLPTSNNSVISDSIIDLSHYNGSNLDFEKAKASGVTAVMHEVTRGNYFVDHMYAINREAATKAGLLWGAYHFAEGDYDAVEQAKYFLQHAKPDGQTILCLDFEVNKYGKVSMTLDQAHQFVNYIKEATGTWPVLYSGHWLKEQLGDNQDSILKNCPLWVAQWTTNLPTIPENWSSWTMWQYTDSQVPTPITTPGIGSCDRDKFNGDETALRQFWQSNSPTLKVQASSERFNGIADLSHHNGPNLDFKAAYAGGMRAVFHKATQGTWMVDKLYTKNRAAAAEAGILWAAYHFAEGDSDPVAQAQYFLKNAKITKGELMALDYEENPTGKTMTIDQAEKFVTEVHNQTGVWPVVYGGHTLRVNLAGNKNSILANCPLWLAEWVEYPPKVVTPTWEKFTFWQFTDSINGPEPHDTPGFGKVDRDIFAGTEEEMMAYWQSSSPKPCFDASTDSLFNGIADLSHHNGPNLDFKAASTGGMRAVFHKATQGTWMVDPMYAKNRAAAAEAGILWGAYHFAEGSSDPVAQAQYFLKNAAAKKGDLLALDYEVNPTGETMTIDQAEKFVTEVHDQTGVWPVVYGGYTLRKNLTGRKSEILGNCPLWLADWVEYPPEVVTPTWEKFTFWQFTDSNKGPQPHDTPGFGKVDRDIFAGTEEEMKTYWLGRSQ